MSPTLVLKERSYFLLEAVSWRHHIARVHFISPGRKGSLGEFWMLRNWIGSLLGIARALSLWLEVLILESPVDNYLLFLGSPEQWISLLP